MKNKEENSIGFLLARSTNLIWKKLLRNFINNGFDVTPEQFGLLMKLKHQGELNQSELADITFKDKVSITKIVNSLEKRDLVVRTIDNYDKRVKRIILTEKAKTILPDIHKIANDTISEAFNKSTQNEIVIFKKVLQNIYQTLAID